MSCRGRRVRDRVAARALVSRIRAARHRRPLPPERRRAEDLASRPGSSSPPATRLPGTPDDAAAARRRAKRPPSLGRTATRERPDETMLCRGNPSTTSSSRRPRAAIPAASWPSFGPGRQARSGTRQSGRVQSSATADAAVPPAACAGADARCSAQRRRDLRRPHPGSRCGGKEQRRGTASPCRRTTSASRD
jgi:hypothetical protein